MKLKKSIFLITRLTLKSLTHPKETFNLAKNSLKNIKNDGLSESINKAKEFYSIRLDLAMNKENLEEREEELEIEDIIEENLIEEDNPINNENEISLEQLKEIEKYEIVKKVPSITTFRILIITDNLNDEPSLKKSLNTQENSFEIKTLLELENDSIDVNNYDIVLCFNLDANEKISELIEGANLRNIITVSDLSTYKNNSEVQFNYILDNSGKFYSLNNSKETEKLKKVKQNKLNIDKIISIKILKEIIKDYRKNSLKLKEEALVINFVILDPAPLIGSGGLRNVFRAVKHLRSFGHYLRVYAPDYTIKKSKEFKDFIDTHFMLTDAEFHIGFDNLAEADAFVATHYSTAYPILRQKEKTKQCFYYVQDYEPYFHPMGYDYIEAENTYKFGFNCITTGPWCTKLLRDRFDAKSEYFNFPIDTNIYYPRKDIERSEKKIVYFARPEMPRRCYPLGIQALEILNKKYPDYEIILFGSSHIDSNQIPFPHTNLGVITDLNVIGELYSSATLGIAFSTTNPSLVPLEMIASGLPVVDLDYNDNWVNYESRENVMLVGTLPQEVADGIEKLVNDKKLREKISKNGLKFIKKFPNEIQAAKRIEELIVREF